MQEENTGMAFRADKMEKFIDPYEKMSKEVGFGIEHFLDFNRFYQIF